MNQKISCSWMHPGTACWVELATEDQTSYPELFARAEVQQVSADESSITVSFREAGLASQFGAAFPPTKVFQSNVYPDAEGFQDMVQMEQLNEAEILYNLKHRYVSDKIFTYIGPTLMAMNPYKAIPEQLSKEVLHVYQAQAASKEPFNLKDTLPHTYAVAGLAYKRLFENTKNQAIVISGESGAGKTENAKIAMKFLTSLSDLAMGASAPIAGEERIEDKILSCNPILEAFGNAKTTRNDNSSRFGKYVRMIVNSDNHQIKGAAINNYLLEKSRVVGPGPEERNYHIFYHLLKCQNAELLGRLFLTDKTAQDFDFLTQGNCVEVSTLNDHTLWKEVEESFHAIKFTPGEQQTVWNILAAILHLGNISFDKSTLTDELPCTILKQEHFKAAAILLNVDEETLNKTLLFKTREVGKSVMQSPLNETDAISGRNSFTSNYYDRLFSWLVKRLNMTIIPKEDLGGDIRKSVKDIRRQSLLGIKLSIGLLDIFGFENFKVNSFEQFCINYTNEKLQQLYISYVFKSEEQEFIYEGLQDQLCELKYSDNQGVIDIMDKTPTGIFDLLDESTQLGSGTDDSLFQKIVKSFKENKLLQVAKTAKDRFIIVHTAKNVEYCIAGFRAKNKSEISGDILKSVLGAKDEQYSNIFLTLCGKEVNNREAEISNLKKPSKSEKFLGSKFRQQMKMLMDELLTSDCHFVRCLKPNEQKQKGLVVESFCLLQIKYLGVLESIRVRKEGFPFRKDYKVFYHQFAEITDKYRSVSLYKQQGDLKVITMDMISILLPNLEKSVILYGKTKFFAKDKMGKLFDQLISDFGKRKHKCAVSILKAWRSYKFKTKLMINLHALAQKIKKFRKLQARWKMIKQKTKYRGMKSSAIKIKQYLIKKDQSMKLHKWSLQVYLWKKTLNQKASLSGLFNVLQKGKQRRTLSLLTKKVVLFREADERRRLAALALAQELARVELELQKEKARLAAIEEERIFRENAAKLSEADRVRAEQDRLAQKKAEQDQAEQVRLQQEKLEQQRLEQQRLDQLNLDQQKLILEQEKKAQEQQKIKADQERTVQADHHKSDQEVKEVIKIEAVIPPQKIQEEKPQPVQQKVEPKSEGTPLVTAQINVKAVDHHQDNIQLDRGVPHHELLTKSNTLQQVEIFEIAKKRQQSAQMAGTKNLVNDEWESQLKNTKEENQLMPDIQEDEISRAQNRRNMTMTNNVLPFMEKDASELEKYARVGKSKSKETTPIGMSVDVQYPFDKLDKSFLQQVVQNKFFAFCMVIVKKRTSWLQEIPLEKLLAHQREFLEDPLQDLPDKMAEQGAFIFDHLLDYPKQKDPIVVVQKIISILFPVPGQVPSPALLQLRDETYLMVIKQMTNCPDKEVTMKYLLLMVVLCSVAPTSERAFFPILNYLHTKIQITQDPVSSTMAQVAFVRLMKSFTRNRYNPPTEMELVNIFSVKQIPIEIFLHESNSMCIPIEPYFDLRQVIEIMVKRLKMTPNYTNLGIVQQRRSIINKQLVLQEYFVDDNELIVNLLYNWVDQSNRATYRLYFRIKVFFIYQPKDLDSICLYYFHFCEQHLRGNFGLSDEQISTLAVYKLIADLGPGSDENFDLEEYVPQGRLVTLNQDALKRRYKNSPNISRMQAMEYFLDELRKQPLFMTWNFQCFYHLKDIDIERIELIVAIRPFQIYICDLVQKNIQVRYHFLQVIRWGQIGQMITMETDDRQIHCFTMTDTQIKMFSELRKSYTELALKQK